MPFTPVHLGIGGLAKGVAPSRVSLTAFALSQVAIDLEPAYYILTSQWPLHRWTHTLAVAVPLGAGLGAATWLFGRLLARVVPSSWSGSPELALAPDVVGGLLGGMSHPLLDGIVHSDPIPFWPLMAGNPLQGLISTGAVHLLCLAAGALGYVLWAGRSVDQGENAQTG